MSDDIVDAHQQDHTFEENILYPSHEPRHESKEFRDNKHHLVHELQLPCWLCGSREHLEAHHWHEWALWNSLEASEALEVLQLIDFYGFAKKLGDKPLNSPDDIRNLVVLCELHHRGKDAGIHGLTFPIWLARRSVKQGSHITRDSLVLKSF